MRSLPQYLYASFIAKAKWPQLLWNIILRNDHPLCDPALYYALSVQCDEHCRHYRLIRSPMRGAEDAKGSNGAWKLYWPVDVLLGRSYRGHYVPLGIMIQKRHERRWTLFCGLLSTLQSLWYVVFAASELFRIYVYYSAKYVADNKFQRF